MGILGMYGYLLKAVFFYAVFVHVVRWALL